MVRSFCCGEVQSAESCSSSSRAGIVIIGLVTALLLSVPSTSFAQHLTLSQSIPLPEVHGRLDHLDIDLDGSHLFLAAFGAGSVEVLDLHAGTRPSRIQGLREPQGVAFMKQGRRLLVAEGGNERVSAFADSKRLAAVEGLDDADNMRFDAAGDRLYVGYGQALAILDPHAMRVVGRVPLAGHPEAFELEPTSPLIYINVPTAGHVAVVDRIARRVVAIWKTGTSGQNFPMALDERDHLLFVGTRRPAMLLVLDTASGSRTAELKICDDADDLFFDGERRQAYAICGDGSVDVIQVQDLQHIRVVEHVQTSPGARTGLFVPQLATLFVAVPAREHAPAEVRAYEVR